MFWTDLSPGEFRSRNTVVTRCAHIVPFRVFCCPWRLVDDCILYNKIFMSLSLLTVTSNTWSQFRRNIILNPFCTSSNQSDTMIFLTCRGIYWRKTQMKRRTFSCKSVVLHNHHWQINRSLSINYCMHTALTGNLFMTVCLVTEIEMYLFILQERTDGTKIWRPKWQN